MTSFLRTESSGVMRRLAFFVLLAACLMLAACGFRMKGATPLPIDTLYTNIAQNSPFGAAMRRAIRAASPNTQFVAERDQADASLIQIANQRNLRELSIDADGRVEEYELTIQFAFQVLDSAGRVILPPTTLRATREIPYDDTVVQAKQSEISTVFEQMQQSLVDRVVRHLTAPEVIEAFANAKNLPVPEDGVPDVPPVQEDAGALDPNMWGAPTPDLNTGMP